MATPNPGTYTPQTQAELPRRVMPQAPNTSIAPGLGAVAGAIGDAGNRYLESQAATYSMKTLASMQQSWTEKLQAAKQNAGDGALNFTPTVLKDYDTDAASVLKSAPTPMARKFLDQRLIAFRSNLAQQALGFESQERHSYSQSIAKDSIDATGNELLNNPDVFGERLAERRALINEMPLDPDDKRQLNVYAQNTLATYATTARMNQDPYGTMQQLSSANPSDLFIKALDPQSRLQLLQKSDSMIRQRVADAMQLDRLRDKQEADLNESLIKEGDKLNATGQLSSAWIEKNRDTLPETAYRYFYNQLSNPEAVTKSDPHVYAPLLERSMGGEDVSEDARKALYSGQLSQPDYTKIAEKSEALRPGYVKRGSDYIASSLAVSQLNPDPDAQRSKANALDDWREWATSHPQATDSEARKVYESLADHYRIIPAQKTTLSMHVPLFLVGDRTAPDLGATVSLTKQQYESGALTREEYGRQAQLILQWQNAYKPKKPP